MRFGELIKNAREQAGLSKTQLASSVEISSVYLLDIERGNRYPSDDTILKLIEKLNLDKIEAIAQLSVERGYLKFDVNDISDLRMKLAIFMIKIWNLPDSELESFKDIFK